MDLRLCILARRPVKPARALSFFRRLLRLVLIAAMVVTSGGWAMADLSDQLQHELEQARTLPDGSGGVQGGSCDHGCVGHLAAHLVASVNVGHAVRDARLAEPAAAPPRSLIILALQQSFFRPPRVFLA